MEDVNLMREFVRLVECRNFTLVAKEFHISQPTMTKHVKRLEAEFGVPLVERTTHTVEITEAGLLVSEGFRRVIAEFNRLSGEVESLKRGTSGRLRMGVLYHGLAELVLPLVARLSAKHPEIEVEFVSCQSHEAYEGILHGELDVAIVLESDERRGIRFVPFSEPELFCVVGSASPLAARQAVHPDDLSSLEWHFLSKDISLSMVEALGIPYRKLVPVSNIDALSVGLSSTDAFTVLDAHLEGKLGQDLRFVPIDPPTKRSAYGAACRLADTRPAVLAFMETASQLAL